MPEIRVPLDVRFWRHVRKTETCWLWTASVQTAGYGQIYVGPRDGMKGKMQGAHRCAWEMFRGPIPEGIVLDHRCGVKRCVNPDHLEPVTFNENARRGKQTMADVGPHPEYPPDSLFG